MSSGRGGSKRRERAQGAATPPSCPTPTKAKLVAFLLQIENGELGYEETGGACDGGACPDGGGDMGGGGGCGCGCRATGGAPGGGLLAGILVSLALLRRRR